MNTCQFTCLTWQANLNVEPISGSKIVEFKLLMQSLRIERDKQLNRRTSEAKTGKRKLKQIRGKVYNGRKSRQSKEMLVFLERMD